MEFQAYNVLVIASDIRQLEHIEYTPAPDIIHEAQVTRQLSRIQNMQNIYVVLKPFHLIPITKCMKPSVCFR
jgi:phenylalanine-4-hydroxylase